MTRRPGINKDHSEQGSPAEGEPVFVIVGKVQRTHGVDGEVVVHAISEDPDRFKPGTRVFVGETHIPYTIRSRRSHDKHLIIAFKGVEEPETAGLLRNRNIYFLRSELPQLPDGRYYHFELVGLKVFDDKDRFIGVLTEVIETGANDVYVATNENGEETLLPAITQVIVSVDIPEGKMIVIPPVWI